ncbi:MAG: peptidogalycan biosysnthesis protein [Spirochaetia bacterium]|nr:peptidogalycan biosysnthesis protein [Spirochaetia bacterium]
MRVLPGTEAPELYFARMAEYYLHTNAQFGPYAARFLSTKFFTEMPERVRQWVWFAAAHEDSKVKNGEVAAPELAPPEDPIALSMLVVKNDRLIGRYWGARRTIKDLHFNTCYYTPIEWAIENGITIFDPGMGSPHKLRRGFRAVPNWSLHYFFDPDMRWILETNMDRINAYEESYIQSLDEAVPYKKKA